MPELSPSLVCKRDRLLQFIEQLGSCVVAFSGGVDSAVVAYAAHSALGSKAIAVTGTSASLAEGEADEAAAIARLIGIQHELLSTDEFSTAAYRANAPDRCYHCKTELYTQLAAVVDRYGASAVLNGANLDDCGDYRPGMAAAAEHRVLSPLVECEITKPEVRALAAAWGLPVWDKPAAPCLSSRIAYGEEVTPARVAMIDQAEQVLRALGLRELRVRYHKGDLARLEVPLDALSRLAEPTVREQLVESLKGLGFKYVTLDLEGFRSGSLNQVLPVESLRVLQ